jgi:hypothetical protein
MGDVILSGTTIYFLSVNNFYSFSTSNYLELETITRGGSENGGDTEPTYEDRLPGMKLDHPEFYS